MTPRTFRLLSGGATPSKTTGGRLRFIESTAISVEHWTVTATDPDDFDLARSGSNSNTYS
jgi:hypothetical protein